MIRMKAPYTGSVILVDESKVESRLERGFSLVDDYEPVNEAEEESETDELEAEESVEESSEDIEDDKPDEDSTMPEIRAYAKKHGIHLPQGTKKELLKIINKH